MEDLALGGIDQVEDDVRHRGLARAGLADERRRRASEHSEGDVIDSPDVRVRALGAAHVENLGQMLDPQDLGSVLRDLVNAQFVLRDLDALGVGGLDALRGQRRRRLDESAGVGVARVLEHVQTRPGLHDAAAVHDDDVLGPLRRQAEVVGHEEHRRSQLVDEAPEVVQNATLDGDVQGAGRLIGDEQPGARRQADGDQGALPHASGELVRILLGAPGGVGEPRVLEQKRHLLGGNPMDTFRRILMLLLSGSGLLLSGSR